MSITADPSSRDWVGSRCRRVRELASRLCRSVTFFDGARAGMALTFLGILAAVGLVLALVLPERVSRGGLRSVEA